ncbi:microfibril-associated glycoprotein 4-like [Pangasianodon hypophthalmus]|uniref:microfibril-associated glycoprotein 4-like n=1 Tax=Pangasianodon hypophthalmus TaxID=310915 RepID=UPI00230704B4|nr:microfibril-associated glycoprotein 4-like [Pangasianodon hypophthalmus]
MTDKVFPAFSVFWTLLLPLLVGSTPISQDLFPTDCSDVYANGQTLSGVYTIYPTADTPVQVYCDMGCGESQTEDGKWTVFQRRMDGTVNFYRPWGLYKKGFGNKYGEYWLGLENLYQLTHKRKYELKVDLQDFEGVSVYARYTSFSVEPEADGYKLSVSSFINGGAGDSMATNNGQNFSTLIKTRTRILRTVLNASSEVFGTVPVTVLILTGYTCGERTALITPSVTLTCV